MTIFKDYVVAYKNGDANVLDQLIKYEWRKSRQIHQYRAVKGFRDAVINHHFRTMMNRYKNFKREYYCHDEWSRTDCEQYYIEFFIKALNEVKLLKEDGSEYSNGALLQFVKNSVQYDLYDLWFKLEGQYKIDLNIPDEELTFDNQGQREFVLLDGFIHEDHEHYKEDEEYWYFDLKSVIDWSEGFGKNHIREFLEVVNIKDLLRDKPKLLNMYLSLIAEYEKDRPMDANSYRDIAKVLGIPKSTYADRFNQLKAIIQREMDNLFQYQEIRFTALERKIIDFLEKWYVIQRYGGINSDIWQFAIDELQQAYKDEKDNFRQLHMNQLETKESIFTVLSDFMKKEFALIHKIMTNQLDHNSIAHKEKLANNIYKSLVKYITRSKKSVYKYMKYDLQKAVI
ncbi:MULTISPECIES: hypothetical protein [Brevibacillus]|uniref:hypothetical protein n=1 Tax=Brevibacillus TaxID=55080 RepID=UPI0024559E8D|nr:MULTISPECIES: hypothetical protein [Brevibacillus]MDH4618081.1 hypothetical protein [Brevibacillus sp. AY1]MED1951835.1 hypothetical protein [Brevibacillus centrosporus]